MNFKKDTKKNEKPVEQDSEKLKKEIEELKKQVQDYKNKYLRALADYQNYEKRVWVEKDQIGESASKNVLLKLLPFLDNLEKAGLFIKDDGLKLIEENFFKSLQEIGLEEIQVVGKPFDPYTAEAIDIIEGKNDNIIVEVLRKGYKFKGKVLRVAQVRVSKKITNSNQQDTNKFQITNNK